MCQEGVECDQVGGEQSALFGVCVMGQILDERFECVSGVEAAIIVHVKIRQKARKARQLQNAVKHSLAVLVRWVCFLQRRCVSDDIRADHSTNLSEKPKKMVQLKLEARALRFKEQKTRAKRRDKQEKIV